LVARSKNIVILVLSFTTMASELSSALKASDVAAIQAILDTSRSIPDLLLKYYRAHCSAETDAIRQVVKCFPSQSELEIVQDGQFFFLCHFCDTVDEDNEHADHLRRLMIQNIVARHTSLVPQPDAHAILTAHPRIRFEGSVRFRLLQRFYENVFSEIDFIRYPLNTYLNDNGFPFTTGPSGVVTGICVLPNTTRNKRY
jgi:hypothetical protein